MESSAPLTLIPSGDREMVDKERASEIVSDWEKQLSARHLRPPQSNSSSSSPFASHVCTKIDLSNKSYSAEAAQFIADFLTKERHDGSPPLSAGITQADLNDIIAGRKETEALKVLSTICNAFRRSKLLEVNLSDNAMGTKGIIACKSVLSGQSSSLESLSLCNNGLSAESMKDVANILCGDEEGGEEGKETKENECICSRLKKLHIYNNMSGYGGCEAFSKILSKCTSNLKDLRFSATRAGKDGSQIIASALDAMGDQINKLERLDLVDNSFKDEAGKILARALFRASSLSYINLSECSIGDSSMGVICRRLCFSGGPIEILDLSGNDLTRKGAHHIACLLQEINTIKILQVDDNEITSLGVITIVKALGEGIEEIRFNNCEIGNKGAHSLIEKYNNGQGLPNLKSLQLDGNMFSSRVVDLLKKTFGEIVREMDDDENSSDADDNLSEIEEEEVDESFDFVNCEKSHVTDVFIEGLAKFHL